MTHIHLDFKDGQIRKLLAELSDSLPTTETYEDPYEEILRWVEESRTDRKKARFRRLLKVYGWSVWKIGTFGNPEQTFIGTRQEYTTLLKEYEKAGILNPPCVQPESTRKSISLEKIVDMIALKIVDGDDESLHSRKEFSSLLYDGIITHTTTDDNYVIAKFASVLLGENISYIEDADGFIVEN
jgi:hypothetical protein